MIKIRNKRIALLLVLAMLATMFVGFGTASAASTNSALTVPSITVGNARTLGTLRVTESVGGSWVAGAAGVGTEIMITLPAGTQFAAAPAALAGYVTVPATVGSDTNTLTGAGDVVFVSGTLRTLVVRIAAITTPGNDKGMINFLFNGVGTSQVNITSGSGDVKVNVFDSTGAVTSGDVVVATIVGAGTSSAALSAPALSEGANRAVGTIRMIENSAGALVVANTSISLILPDGCTWNTAPVPTITGGGGTLTITGNAIDTDATGHSRKTYNVTALSTLKAGVIDFTGLTIDVSSTAKAGDVIVQVGGNNAGVSATSLTIAKNASYGVVVTSSDTPSIYAGRFDATVGKVTLEENIFASLVGTRTISLELPTGIAWGTIPTANTLTGDVVVGAGALVAGTTNKVTYTVTTQSTSASKVEFRSGTVNVAVDQTPGDITVNVAGTATATGSVSIGKVIAPITATAATKPNVVIGLQSEAAGDITITEAAAGVILANPRNTAADLQLVGAAGVTFSATPTVTVTSGDLVIDTANVKRFASNARVSIPIKTGSTTASTITISGIKLTVDRTVPEGDIKLAIRGMALDMNTVAGVQSTVPVLNAAAVAAANCVTEANNQTIVYTSTFVVGASTYKLNGVDQTCFAPSYIKDSRTYMAIRDIGAALGIDQSNIIWDGTKNSVTLMKGDKVVQMTIGSKTLLINGAAITMDVAPEVGPTDRTMLPAAFVAMAFGSAASYDAATQTVTIK